ncbi:hypothetical protein [Streptomyces sp. NRRL B-3648]|uniref:hypothetical protein n=1 Tax=Streptomyces sp. NRRL B-3648 TaxID=1519493 RepID=UPI00131CF2AF|nr:hypothetical protein [Streptomyces sp. NRRL B-3648]
MQSAAVVFWQVIGNDGEKNLAERSQQQGAVMYTAAAGSDAPAAGDEAEKVPAQV